MWHSSRTKSFQGSDLGWHCEWQNCPAHVPEPFIVLKSSSVARTLQLPLKQAAKASDFMSLEVQLEKGSTKHIGSLSQREVYVLVFSHSASPWYITSYFKNSIEKFQILANINKV